MEVYSGELEAARLDALRRIPIAQVVDPATPPDRPDSPHRAFIATVAACLSSLLAIALVGARALRDAKTIGASPALQPQTT
jgi:uncharacterized protein involved in exopolysaccharide biosynthesis